MMFQKLSREVMRRAKLCDLVVGSVRVQGQAVAGSLGETLAPFLQPGQALPDFATPLVLVGQKLQAHCDRMVAADEAHRANVARAFELRGRRRERVGVLKETILDLRATCRGLIGDAVLPTLGLDFRLAQDARGVLRQAEIIRGRLLAPGLELLPKRRWTCGKLDPRSMAEGLEDDAAGLRGVVRELVDLRREANVTVVAKRKAIEEFDAHYVPLARLLEANFRVAGHLELADRIRPTVRQLRRAGTAPQDPPEASPGS